MRELRARLLAAAALLPGCASITTSDGQEITVHASRGGEAVSGAQCEISNDRGRWTVVTPGSVSVRLSFDDLGVRCEKEGLEPGLVSAKSGAKGATAGNILFGGLVGVAVDMTSGAAYYYPTPIVVQMGEVRVIEPPPSRQ